MAHLRVTFEVLHWIVVSFSLFFLHFSLSLFLMRQIRLSYIFEGDEAQMMAMENGGNEIVNLFLEAKLTDTDRRPEPNSNKVIRRRFAKEKYINQQYLDAVSYTHLTLPTKA